MGTIKLILGLKIYQISPQRNKQTLSMFVLYQYVRRPRNRHGKCKYLFQHAKRFVPKSGLLHVANIINIYRNQYFQLAKSTENLFLFHKFIYRLEADSFWF